MISSCLHALACAASLLQAGGAFNGIQGQLDVRIPRIEAAVVVDGQLAEPVWQSAARLVGFSRYAPTDGASADDSTEVLVWYSPTAIHFGVRAYAEPGTVRATLADRDKLYADDYIGLFIGTFNDGRQATVFAANPLGVQGDGILVETGTVSGGFSGLAVGREETDIRPDYVFESKGRLTGYGYEVEIRIPFKSLTFQPAETQSWSFNVIRKVQSRGYEYSWAPARRAAASYIAQHGHLTGITGLSRGLVLDVNPVATSRVEGAAAPGGYGYRAERPKLGGNVRWGITNNLTASGTLRPDFAEVESDAGQLVYDPRQALFFTEKRPFFLDGLEQFSTPSNLVYTRRIVAPVAAVKFSGKVAGTSVAMLSAVDAPALSATGLNNPLYGILRLRRDVGTSSRLGIIVTDREDGASSNRVYGSDLRVVFSKSLSAQAQGAFSTTSAQSGPSLTGSLWNASLMRSGTTFNARYTVSAISDGFRTLAGFISRPSIARINADHSISAYGRRGGLVERATLDVVTDGTWAYRQFVNSGDAIEKKLHFNANFNLRGGWQAGVSLLLEVFGFDPVYYAPYAVQRVTSAGADTVPFGGRARIPNRDYVLSLTTPRFSHFSMNGSLIWGQDENFYEWAPADVGIVNASANWNPTEQLRVAATYIYQTYHRRTDGSLVARSRIPRLKVEYQITPSTFVRVVGQYAASYQDSLRNDAGAGEPILIRRGGVYTRALGGTVNSIRADWLFSFMPSPGTVVYAGYGSTMTEPESFRFNDIVRQQDAYFVKLSYLFRM
ncbi:MAG: carbohydrate binding family 9 domain-containing protein [Gemmatimonadaceae bacterium]|nr:carbohydrate binding family 9 domain-containing protein [Gemmatimonadaceae bacterium]